MLDSTFLDAPRGYIAGSKGTIWFTNKKTTPAQVPTKVCLSVTNADTMGFLLTIQNAKLCQDEVGNRVEFVAFFSLNRHFIYLNKKIDGYYFI